jgi:hypothetical protein
MGEFFLVVFFSVIGGFFSLVFFSNIATLRVQNENQTSPEPVSIEGSLRLLSLGFDINKRYTYLIKLQTKIAEEERNLFQKKIDNELKEEFANFTKRHRLKAELERRVKSLVAQKNILISHNSNTNKLLDERQRHVDDAMNRVMRQQTDLSGKRDEHVASMSKNREYAEFLKTSETSLAKVQANLKQRENDLSKLESVERKKAESDINELRIKSRSECIELAKKAQFEAESKAEKIINDAHKKERKIISQAAANVEKQQQKELKFLKSIETLSKKTPIEDFELAFEEKYKGISSLSTLEQESLAHICFLIKQALDDSGRKAPDFLNMVNVAPDIFHANQVKSLIDKFAREVTNIKNNEAINADEKEIQLEQWEEFREREFARIMDT